MEELWTDSIILQSVWKSFMDKLLGEWDEIILWVMFHVVLSLGILRAHVSQSTVMLAANVAFLAIPGVMFLNTNSGNLVIFHHLPDPPACSQ